MNNLIFSLNATMPIFLTMLVGMLFRRIGILDDHTASKLNTLVFKAALPVQLFLDLAVTDFVSVWDTSYVVFCFLATFAGIMAMFGLSFLLKDKSIQGEFIQAGYRSSASILGIAFIQNIYGSSAMGPLMIVATVPLYNIFAVIVLSVFKKEREPLDRKLMVKTLKGILTNPIILGIAAGFAWSLTGWEIPTIPFKTLKNVSALATPLGLMCMGASFRIHKVKDQLKPAVLAMLMKLVFQVLLFVPAAIALGFYDEKLIAALIMLGSPTTVAGYIMAKNMGHEGTLTGAVVMFSTLFSAFTLTLWLYLLKTLGYV